EVPHRAVDARDGLEQRLPTIAMQVGEREHPLPDPLALEDVEAGDARHEILANEPRDLAAVLAVVAVEDLADGALVGGEARDHGAAGEDVVRAAAEILRERDLERDRFDAGDTHGGHFFSLTSSSGADHG